MNDFDKADMEGEELVSLNDSLATLGTEVVEGPNREVSSVVDYRNKLVEEYHGGSSSLIERIRKGGNDDADSILVALIDEVIKETDHLLGNELVATESGDLRDASVISFKRAEVIEKAIRAVQAKQKYEKESGIDIDSPSMIVIFKFFMTRVKETFDEISLPREQNDMFFNAFGVTMENWKKDLKEEFELLKSGG